MSKKPNGIVQQCVDAWYRINVILTLQFGLHERQNVSFIGTLVKTLLNMSRWD